MPIACSLVLSPEHRDPDHPESPERFRSFKEIQASPIASKISWIDPQEASLDSVRAVHRDEML